MKKFVPSIISLFFFPFLYISNDTSDQYENACLRNELDIRKKVRFFVKQELRDILRMLKKGNTNDTI